MKFTPDQVKDIKIEIIYQDQDVLVINKPAGLVVNRAKTVKFPSLQDWLEANIKEIKEKSFPHNWQELLPANFDDQYGTPEEIFEQRTGLAHRLDKDTSGVMLIAKHPGALVNLLQQFRLRETQKEYLCLVHGKFAMTEGLVNLPLGRRSKNRKLMAVVSEGREAVTEYQVKQFYPFLDLDKVEDLVVLEQLKKFKQQRFSIYDGFSLVSCWPKTGRTHQIRVHMAHLQHALVGDKLYAGKKRVKLDAWWCKRQFLHAKKLAFNHPRTGKRVEYQASLTTDLMTVLTLLVVE